MEVLNVSRRFQKEVEKHAEKDNPEEEKMVVLLIVSLELMIHAKLLVLIVYGKMESVWKDGKCSDDETMKKI